MSDFAIYGEIKRVKSMQEEREIPKEFYLRAIRLMKKIIEAEDAKKNDRGKGSA